MSYMDAPELLDGIKSDNLFQKIIPVIALFMVSANLPICTSNRLTNLAAWWLGEPQSPLVLQRMLHVEVVLVVEHGNRSAAVLCVGIVATRRNGDGGKIHLLVHVGRHVGSLCGLR